MDPRWHRTPNGGLENGPYPDNNYKENSVLKFKKFTRRTFEVEAVRVTEHNMYEIAEWCGGGVSLTEGDDPKPYIKVNTSRPVNIRQTQAFPGDWVLKSPGKDTYKVYTNRSLNQSFVVVRDEKPKEMVEWDIDLNQPMSVTLEQRRADNAMSEPANPVQP